MKFKNSLKKKRKSKHLPEKIANFVDRIIPVHQVSLTAHIIEKSGSQLNQVSDDKATSDNKMNFVKSEKSTLHLRRD